MRYECEQVELKRKDDGTDLYLTKFWCPASWQEPDIKEPSTPINVRGSN